MDDLFIQGRLAFSFRYTFLMELKTDIAIFLPICKIEGEGEREGESSLQKS